MFIKRQLTLNEHFLIGVVLRIGLIIYSEIHDLYAEVRYTDIDYKVVTDGARHILNNNSPFQRHTYRYSPLLAYLLIPNILIHNCLGKILFSACDIFVAILIEKTVRNELQCTFFESTQALLMGHRNSYDKIKNFNLPSRLENWIKWATLFWLYNPLAMAISTRGNGDALSSIFVISTIYFIVKHNSKLRHSFFAGLCHGIAIHLRIYPFLFSVAFFLSLSGRKLPTIRSVLKQILLPNRKQLFLVLGTITSFTIITGYFYNLYGYEYIYEAYLYHFLRKDIRHNFSLYFLMQYLCTDINLSIIEKILINLPKIITLLYLTFHFGKSRKTLAFCIFAQTFTIVTYNTVITSQYFVWYLTLLPLCMKNFRNISIPVAVTYFSLWILSQGLWLLPAYLLEFKTWNTFNFIGIQSVVLFFVNIFILQRFIYNFKIFRRIKKIM